jgi:hypothetical protein
MTTISELIEELSRFPRDARVTVLVGLEEGAMVLACHENANLEIDFVQPVGCNPNDVQILLGREI